MIVVTGIEGLEPAHGRLFVVLGVFDGLHLGHEYLLRELRRGATARDARPTVITFDHHPDEILTGSAPPLLCDPVERLERLAAAGAQLTVVHHFDMATRRTPYDVFVRRIAARVDLAGFLMTPESAFGFERRGTPDALAALGRELGYDVLVVPTLELNGQPVRSAEIRAAIARGELDVAARLLGRPYALVGEVSPGEGRDASSVDQPLALSFEMPVALPPPGAYEVWVSTLNPDPHVRTEAQDGVRARAMIDLGRVSLEGQPVSAGRLRVVFA